MLKGISIPVELFERIAEVAKEKNTTISSVGENFIRHGLVSYQNGTPFAFKSVKKNEPKVITKTKLREPKTIKEALKESPQEFADNFEEEKSVISIRDLKAKKKSKKVIKTMEDLDAADLN